MSLSERARRLIAKAERHLQTGKSDPARKAYRQALKMHPDHLQILHQLAALELNSRNASRAVPILRKLADLQPGDTDSRLRLAEALDDSADVDEALAVVRGVLKDNEGNAEAHNVLGNMLQGRGDFEAALAAYSRGLELRTDAPPIWNNAGNMLDELGRHDGAAQHYTAAIRLNARDGAAHYYRARALAALGQAEPAMADIKTALALDPTDQRSLALKGVLFAMLGQDDDAARLFDYDRFVKTYNPEPPKGYRTIDDFNAAAINHIRNRAKLEYNPAGASTRGGWHSGNLLDDKHAIVAALRSMLQQVFEEHVSQLAADTGDHPALRKSYSSVRLVAQAQILESQGYLLSHIHPGGWISSAYYLSVPDEISQSGDEHAGWLEFGRPTKDIKADVTLETRAVRPEPGMAVLFPSFFFHGTRPFQCDTARISLGIDLIAPL